MRVINSDRAATVGRAKLALSRADTEGWSRINSSFTRHEVIYILTKPLIHRDDSEIIGKDGLHAKNIRREVGIDGQLRGLTHPLRRHSQEEEWPND